LLDVEKRIQDFLNFPKEKLWQQNGRNCSP
jgi:hypothetical protein